MTMSGVAGSGDRRQRRARLRRSTLAAVAAVTAGGMIAGVGTVYAAEPETLRPGCFFASEGERAQNVQTCPVWSDSMEAVINVKVRPSDRQAGESEQAVYFLGALSDPITNGRAHIYDTGYNLVTINNSDITWSANWQEQPVASDGGGFYPADAQWETFIGEELPQYLNENFEISTSGNALSGLSISGGQAVNLALKYPEVFSVAVSRSGYYHTDNLLGYLAVPAILAFRQGVSNGLGGMWGYPLLPGNTWAENDIGARIAEAKANGQTIIISTGNGLPASQAELDEMMANGGLLHVAIGIGLELVSLASAVVLNVQAEIFDLPIQFIYTDGAHTWNRWIRTDEEEVRRLQEALDRCSLNPPQEFHILTVADRSERDATLPAHLEADDTDRGDDEDAVSGDGPAAGEKATAKVGAPGADAADERASDGERDSANDGPTTTSVRPAAPSPSVEVPQPADETDGSDGTSEPAAAADVEETTPSEVGPSEADVEVPQPASDADAGAAGSPDARGTETADTVDPPTPQADDAA